MSKYVVVITGAEVINMMGDRVRVELFRRIGMEDLLKPHEAA